MSLNDTLTLIIGGVAAGAAAGALVQACVEYLRSGRQSRAEMFFELRRRLKDDPLGEIAELVDEATHSDATGDRARDVLARMSLRQKRDYVGLFEEVSLMLDWRLVEPAVAHYMFGYYAIQCWESDAFWAERINKWSPYWARFHTFYESMKIEKAKMDRSTALLGRAETGSTVSPAIGPPDVAGPRVVFRIPPVLRPSVGGAREVEARGLTVGAVLENLATRWPDLRSQVFDPDGDINRYINVYLNDEDARVLDGLATPVAEGDKIVLLPGMSGGA
jgi:molybdopterin converting factor small subunit